MNFMLFVILIDSIQFNNIGFFKARDAEIAKMMKAEAERAAEADVIKEKEKYHERVRYQQQLEKQLEEQELNKQKAYEEFLKEKLMIDEIVRKIYEEDLRSVGLNTFSCILRVFFSYIRIFSMRV